MIPFSSRCVLRRTYMKKNRILNRVEIEQLRAQILERVENEALSLKDAAQLLLLSYPQIKRLFSRFKAEGRAGLAHRLRGQPSNRAFDPARKAAILQLYQQRYPDFGPTLACEKLVLDDYQVDHETLRR